VVNCSRRLTRKPSQEKSFIDNEPCDRDVVAFERSAWTWIGEEAPTFQIDRRTPVLVAASDPKATKLRAGLAEGVKGASSAMLHCMGKVFQSLVQIFFSHLCSFAIWPLQLELVAMLMIF